jgi:hypothetical protein
LPTMAAAVADEYMETAMDNDDVFPCKGCGEILEEGKAFELAGNRWHLDCFRCNTCGTLLDSDANLLLLGDGSLICNNCTYSCSACNNKIEDLAILTGDQAFCATCFRCRNCKRKIENLRYARTSQGIFCMACHETLMARRRKKSKAAAAAKARDKELSPMITEKSLPALPPNVIPNGAFSNDRVDPDSDTPTELSPRPRVSHRATESSSRASSRPSRSPERQVEPRSEGLSLPASTYRKNRNSTIMAPSEGGANESGDGFFISVALDPSPGPALTPRSGTESVGESKRKDYFSPPRPSIADKRNESVSSHHIAFQDRGRQYSSDFDAKASNRKLPKSQSDQGKTERSSPASSKTQSMTEDFKLQDAPNTRRLAASHSAGSQSPLAQDSAGLGERRTKEGTPSSRDSDDSRYVDEDDARPSLDAIPKAPGRADNNRASARKELPSSLSNNATNGKPRQQVRMEEPAAAGGRQGQARSEQKGTTDTYMQPRMAPAPPMASNHTAGKESVSSNDQSSPKPSPKLPRWSSGASFSMDEDMARILGTDEGSSSILRRVSNVVRHGRTNSVEMASNQPRMSHARSISETARASMSPRWPKTPVIEDMNGQAHQISSPMSVTSIDDPAMLKRQLRNSEQRVAELERQFNTEKDLLSLNQKLIEKRKTVSVLDTQTEIMIRQLEVLAGYVERAKDTKQPIDPRDLEDSAIKEFVQKLEHVKIAMSESIAQLHEERDRLVEEKNHAAADRDRALMEFEQLSSKNAQLADMNNDLTHQIQGRFKSHIGDGKAPNGLGIYGQNKAAMSSSVQLETASTVTGTTLVSVDDEPVLESGPTVVQVRKGQVKKFNWKKGSKTMAQNITKGVGRAVVAFQNDRGERIPHPQGGYSTDNIGIPYNSTVTQVVEPAAPAGPNGQVRMQHGDAGRQGFGFFSSKKGAPMPKSGSSATVAVPAEAASTLFGSELSERSDYERRQIPSVVTRCIEEVELRGMDQEGIYRKTGGNSQVNMIKDGFEKDENFDISDPDLDITAVTSVLKQYFRKLPTPLLTFDVYERVLESNAIVDPTERCQHLHKTFAMMPQRHWDCLEFLMFHLQRVAKRESENLMSPKNLAVVFAPTIMRDLSIEREMTDMHAKNLAIQFVIEQSHKIFDEV